MQFLESESTPIKAPVLEINRRPSEGKISPFSFNSPLRSSTSIPVPLQIPQPNSPNPQQPANTPMSTHIATVNPYDDESTILRDVLNN